MAFLSLLDDRAKPKGSRDPLGFELVWTHFGRKVIGNLTTITSSINNFAVALLGFHWAEQQFGHIDQDNRHQRIREYFLKYEQLAAYLRFYADAHDIMGITRVRQRLLDEDQRVALGSGSRQQILSDQVSYGLWGLYSTALRDTGLVLGNDREVTAAGRDIARKIEANLGEVANTLLTLIQSTKSLDRDMLKRLAPGYQKAISRRNVQTALVDQLMGGSDPTGLQRELWSITQSMADDHGGLPETVNAFIGAVFATQPSAALTQSLRDILEIERVLVAANNLFHYCRRKDGEPLTTLLATLKDRYVYSYLPEDLPSSTFPRKAALEAILQAFRENDASRALTKILELNRVVMAQRNGAPWVETEVNRTLRVRVKSELAELCDQASLEQDWDYDYFLGSYLAIARQQLGTI